MIQTTLVPSAHSIYNYIVSVLDVGSFFLHFGLHSPFTVLFPVALLLMVRM